MSTFLRYVRSARLPFLVSALIAGVVALFIMGGSSPARAYDDYLDIDCNDNPVMEGDTFRLHIESTQPYLYAKETMKVHWDTIPITADESDYHPLHHEGQSSNGYQTENSRMGRMFYTTDDTYSEFTEKFRVRADNASSDGSGAGSCVIEIEDDDGPGAVVTWIASTPSGGPEPSPDEVMDETASPWYNSGETIRIKQQFTEKVVVSGGEVNLGIRIGSSEDYFTRAATYVSGTGTDTLTFEYRFTDEDSDADGIEVPGSDYGGDGYLLTLEGNRSVNSNYLGTEGGPGQQVFKGPFLREMSFSSTPPNGDTYKFGETIEVQALFDRPVQVDGDAAVRVKIGNDGDSWADAAYESGSGTDTLLFSYEIRTSDIDFDGLGLEEGYIDAGGATHGVAANLAVTDTVDGLAMDQYYGGLEDQPAHKVDGRPYVTGIAVTSTPPNGERYRIGDDIEFTATFDQDLSIVPPLNIPITIGDGYNAETWQASYSSSSHDNKLVFVHTVGNQQSDSDGISISPGRRILDLGSIYASGTTVQARREIPALPDQEGHEVYGYLPVVRDSSITSSPATGDTYRAGEAIEVSLTFYYEVDVVNIPTVRLLVGHGKNQRYASYSGGTGTDTIVFAYEVQPADLDSDGVALKSRITGGFEGGGWINEKGTLNRSKGRIEGFAHRNSHKVDGRPYVVSAAITSTPASRGIYRAGETVEVSLDFDQAVDVDGTPSINLALGDEGGERDAAYVSGSGSTTLVFAYEVVSSDRDSDGVSLPAKDGDGFGGEATITASGTEVEANGELPGLDDQLWHMVDGEVAVVSVAIDSDPGYDFTYEKGDSVEVVVEFDDSVTVTGAPQIQIDLDGSAAVAEFQEVRNESGDAVETGTTLVFIYTIQEGDEDVDGIAINENSLVLNRGTIADDGGNAANLAHDSVLAEGHLVGAVPPVLESAAVSEDGTEVVLTFSEKVHVLPEIRVLSAFAGVDVGIYLQTLVDIFVEDHRPYITDASVSDTRLTLTLDTPFTTGQLVEVAYDNIFASDVSGLLVDEADNPLEPFSRQEATNNSTEPDNLQALWPEVATHSLTVPNGGSNTYTMLLSAQPAEDVTVSLTVLPEGHVTASPMQLTFTSEDWDTPQTITLTAGAHDHDLNFWQEIIHTSDAEDFISGHMKVLVEN